MSLLRRAATPYRTYRSSRGPLVGVSPTARPLFSVYRPSLRTNFLTLQSSFPLSTPPCETPRCRLIWFVGDTNICIITYWSRFHPATRAQPIWIRRSHYPVLNSHYGESLGTWQETNGNDREAKNFRPPNRPQKPGQYVIPRHSIVTTPKALGKWQETTGNDREAKNVRPPRPHQDVSNVLFRPDAQAR